MNDIMRIIMKHHYSLDFYTAVYLVAGTSTSANISPFGDTSLTTHLRGVTCQGSESRLLDCSNATGSTSSNRDVSMQCYGYGGEIYYYKNVFHVVYLQIYIRETITKG